MAANGAGCAGGCTGGRRSGRLRLDRASAGPHGIQNTAGMNTRPLIAQLVALAFFVGGCFGQAVVDPMKKALEKYPDLGKAGTTLHTKFIALYQEAKKNDPTSLQDPNWPAILAEKAAALVSQSGAALTPAVPLTVAPPPHQDDPGPAGQAAITGAFGKKLGDVFDPASAIGKGALTDGTPMYQIQPDKPFRSFTSYYVLITPTSHKIWSIWGIGPCENTESGEKEQALLMDLLEKKYGPKDADDVFNGLASHLNKTQFITKGGRYLMTQVPHVFKDHTVEVRYVDGTLGKTGEQERLKAEGKKVDASGL